ncbi:AN1-type zinc finger protein 2A [Pelomyxa schiedti]|nr:AN1-type zinc finger protein 2A [Pelomyxa schiedti]
MVEFCGIGARCAVETCMRQDYLPFTCELCHHQFCSDHRSSDAHHCQFASSVNKIAIFCPACGATLPTTADSDHNKVVWEHMDQGACKNRPAQHKCAATGCNTSIGNISCLCPKCNLNFCLKHRFPDDHSCAPKKGASKAAPNTTKKKPTPSKSTTTTTTKAGKPTKPTKPTKSNTTRKTGDDCCIC